MRCAGRRGIRTRRCSALATIALCLVQGGSVLVAVALLYAWLQATGATAPVARTMGFIALVAGNLGLIFAHRSPNAPFKRVFRGENPALWWVVGSALAALAVTVYWPPLQALFRFAPIAARDLAMAFAVGIAAVILFSAIRVVATRGPVRRAA